jgi:short-subunit dehydrogenase
MNVIITGASRGLGRAIAEKFAANNHNLFITSRNEMLLYKVIEEWQTVFPDITIKAKAFDLAKKDQAIAFGEWILDCKISVNILINNAGAFLPGNLFDEEDGVLEKMIETNLYSAYHITRVLLPKMIKEKKGHIFNMCSIASLKGYENGGSYSISKFALSGFSKNLRDEMKPHGIKVTTIYPGAAYTDSWAASGVEAKRLMEANDIAEMVFAASQLSSQACVEDIILRPQLGDL